MAAMVFAWSDTRAQSPNGQKFKDWTIMCDEQPQNESDSGCYIVQHVVNNQNQQPMMRMAIGYVSAERVPIAVISLPLGIRLPPGAELQVDQNEIIRLAFERCMPDGCHIQFRLKDSDVAGFKAGAGGRVTFQDPNGRPVAVPFSLSGFTAALANLP